MRFLLLVVGDSRCKLFEDFEISERNGRRSYDVHYCIKRGARIEDLIESAVNFLERIDSNRLVIVKVAAGINNLTVLDRLTREISPSNTTAQAILNDLVRLKNAIQLCHPKCLVSFCTIPPVNFRVYAEYQQKKGGSYGSKPEQTLRAYTDQVIAKVVEINRAIKITNSISQLGVSLNTASFHSNCLQDKPNNKHRIVVKSMYDGLHPTRATALVWYNKIHRHAAKECEDASDL